MYELLLHRALAIGDCIKVIENALRKNGVKEPLACKWPMETTIAMSLASLRAMEQAAHENAADAKPDDNDL